MKTEAIAAAAAAKTVAPIPIRRFVLRTSCREAFLRQIRQESRADVAAAVIEGHFGKHQSTAAGL